MTYLSPTEILYIHNRLVDELGAQHGIEGVAVLKKAVKFMRNSEVFPDRYAKAAALFFAIAKKKPFKNLNPVTALFATALFLDLNGIDFEIERQGIQDFMRSGLHGSTLEEIKSMVIQNSHPKL